MQLSSPTVLISPEEVTVAALPALLHRHFNTVRKNGEEMCSGGCSLINGIHE